MKIEERENLSIPEVAELLKCSVVTVHNMRIRGDIVAAKLPNGRYRVHQSEVDRLLNTDGSRRANVAKRETPRVPLGMTLDEEGVLLAWCDDGTIWYWSIRKSQWTQFESIPPRIGGSE